MRKLGLLVVLALALAAPTGTALAATPDPGTPVFTDSVASGDVTPTRAILWTRVDRATTLKLEVWPNAALTGQKTFQKTFKTTAANDFTAKVDVSGLTANTTYYYRFRHEDILGDVGTFKTAPDASTPADARFTYTADADGTRVNGVPFFNNFETLDRVREENGDFFVYLGDTIYSDSGLRPNGPATTLDEYRDAYAVNRSIPALPNLMKSTSTYAAADDHEVYNDYDAETVNPARFAAGRKAFFENMPIRETGLLQDPSCAGEPLFRTYHWGSDVDLFVLDERSCRSAEAIAVCQGDLAPTAPSGLRTAFGLPASPPPGCLAALNDPGRTLLGPVQKAAFKNALSSSTAKFKYVINEDPIQQLYFLPYDRWEGYGGERKEILNYIKDNSISRVVFLTTDSHANLVNQAAIDAFAAPTPIANELVTGPIATYTLYEDVLRFGGSFALTGVRFLVNLAGVDCRNLNIYSYGVINQSQSAGTANVTLKDSAGGVVTDEDNEAPCTKTFGP